MVAFVLYILTIVAANLAITYVGPVPVGFGLVAPAGVYAAGLAFSLRDAVQEGLGRRWTVGAIVLGAALSAALSPSLALASGVAFLVSEGVDFLVYSPLKDRGHWLAAVGLSNTAGLIADSVLFLLLAFGDLSFLAGQVWGKFEVTLATVLVLLIYRQRSRISGRAA